MALALAALVAAKITPTQPPSSPVHCLTPCPPQPIAAPHITCVIGNMHRCLTITHGHHVPSAEYLDQLLRNATLANVCVSWNPPRSNETMKTCVRAPPIDCTQFPDVLSPTVLGGFLEMLRYFHAVTQQNGADYALVYGTALGILRFNKFLPWDDDIDIYLKPGDAGRVQTLIQPPYCTHRMSPDLWKFYLCDSPHAGRYPWRYPFVDVWSNIGAQRHRPLNEAHLFPSTPARIYNLTLNVPRDMDAHVKERYGANAKSECITSHWNHRLETNSGNRHPPVNCNALQKKCFPKLSHFSI